MQPIGNIWSKFPRTVRDVAVSCGKQVRIEMVGKETELDKTIIEAIKDPVTHLVRNAVDHGIETPEARKAAAKDAEGLLFLRAFHEGGQVNIEITDDGAGLDVEKIRKKAVQKALISADQAARMTEREITNLIFLPGFSTAEKVTNVSGRGVGMDVVKTNIEKIGGTVDVQSKLGQGTTVRMKIPLTLAIIPALIVTSGGDRYAIPQVSLLELVRLEGEQARKGIETVQGAPVYRLRGRLLPLVYLDRELHRDAARQESASEENVNIVVLQADDRQFGLVVDDISDTEEIVVKPLSKQLKSINIYAGATIMGDGKVALILDVLGLAECANVVSEARDRVLAELDDNLSRAKCGGAEKAVLLFQYGENGRMAIDLSMVARLEEFPVDAVEMADGLEAVQYRGQIMPLIRVSEVLQTRQQKSRPTQSVQVVVYADQERRIGLVIDRILDIVQESFVIERQTQRKGVIGSAVIQKRITDVLDVPGLIAAAKSGDRALSALAGGERSMANAQQFCTFFLKQQFFGVPVQQVQEVNRYQEMTRVALVPRVIRGLINLRGQIVMAIDLRRRLGMEDRPENELPMNVVVRTGDCAVSFLVDDIGDVLGVDEDCFEPPPETLQGELRELVRGVYKLQERLLLVLDIEKALASNQAEEVGHA